jgi:hypothetical protein
MMSNILKPNCASRRWRVTRRKRNPLTCVREATVVAVNTGKSKRPPAFKPTPFNVSDFQKSSHEKNAVVAHSFHADRSVFGTFGRSPANRNPLTVAQRKALP